MSDKKKRRPGRKPDLSFPWEESSAEFKEEDTSEYLDLAQETGDKQRGPKHQAGPDEDIEDTDEVLGKDVEDTDEVFVERDDWTSSKYAPPLRPPPHLQTSEQARPPSRATLSPDHISQIIQMNQPRPGPILRLYHALRPDHRILVYRSAWMLGASLIIVGLFTSATYFLFPDLEESMVPVFGPQPKYPARFFPEPGQHFALVEDRLPRSDRFVAGMEALWLTSDPISGVEIDDAGPYLVKDGERIARLDVQPNWNGMYRLYFSMGDLDPGDEVDLVIPIKNGGLRTLHNSPAYGVHCPGGALPDKVVLGPLEF